MNSFNNLLLSVNSAAHSASSLVLAGSESPFMVWSELGFPQ